ncbi:hypothetical protein WG68_00975 [Arsukibacterium ikkense]|uniref:DUF2339 domain-containing protein n=1 Tax=Arsukibacterium ikkense TaxID=336831 RepID=A0A0M2V8U0_9GAMM|nr:DUF2339 domain-containing protein [Arsukibacterium ikkense]KKO47252.1 hypothetical protein WG68_00975 [Arsukibacterium ikkense]
MFELMAVLAVLLVLVGSVCGIVAMVQLSGVRQQLAMLAMQLQPTADNNASAQVTKAAVTSDTEPAIKPVMKAASADTITAEIITPLSVNLRATTTIDMTLAPASRSVQQAGSQAELQAPANWLGWLERQLIDRGMVWLGGLALAFGGIFLVRHSLDAGWFSPTLRIVSGVAMGLLLVAGSEWLHRKRLFSQALDNYIPAALASAGFITLYAALLMAYQFYQLLPAGLTFALLALVALSASWFSLRQGSILAVIGIVGAYAVPLLVNTGSNNLLALLLYVGVITSSSVLVEQRVRRPWLWYLPMAAHCLWLLAALGSAAPGQVWLLWLALLLSMVLLVWLPRIGWRGQRLRLASVPLAHWWPPLREHGLGAVLLLLSVCCLWQFNNPISYIALVALITLLYLMALSDGRSELWLWAGGGLALCWAALNPIQPPSLLEPLLDWFSGSLLQTQLLLLLLCAPLLVRVWLANRLQWSAVLAVLPVLLLGLSYHLASAAVQQQLQPAWMLFAALLVMLQALLAHRTSLAALAFIHSAGANFALTFCFALYLQAAALTVAIAVQLVLMSLLSFKARLPLPAWLVKGLLALILLRLTLAPLTGSYEGITMLGLHWSLVVYPLTLGCLLTGWWLWRGSALQAVLEGACLHLLAVFISVQTQYWLNAQVLDFNQLNFTTMVVHSFNWLLLALVYQWRSYQAGALQRLYRLAAGVLLVLAGLLQLQLNTSLNPFFSDQALGRWPLLNLLLFLWGLPALLCYLLARLGAKQQVVNRYQPGGYYLAAGLALLFLIGSVRHFWQGPGINLALASSNAEHYSYSLVFLVLAVLVVVLAELRRLAKLRKAGFALLFAVVLKVFIFDLNELSGLLRAASFIGLGLSLVLLSALFQRLQHQQPAVTAPEAGSVS